MTGQRRYENQNQLPHIRSSSLKSVTSAFLHDCYVVVVVVMTKMKDRTSFFIM